MAKRSIPRKAAPRRKSTTWIKPSYYFYVFLLLVFVALYWVLLANHTLFKSPNMYYYVARSTSYKELLEQMENDQVIEDSWTFQLAYKIYGDVHIRPGMYVLPSGLSNYGFWKLIEKQELRPTKNIELPHFRSRKKTVEQLCKLTQVDVDSVWTLLRDDLYVNQLGGFDIESVYVMFRPGTYRVFKKMNSTELLERMYSEYVIFWNAERTKNAKNLKLSEDEVVILSSIVYSETKDTSEMTNIAGVYINRLNRGMKLESDPTVLYAHVKMDAGRVREKHLTIDSEYNTYKYKGLPPGPISIAPSFVVDKVLEYQTPHDYLFFCAKDNFSGSHVFAIDYSAHKKNAALYQRALNIRDSK
jgi:UPF0755 protein